MTNNNHQAIERAAGRDGPARAYARATLLVQQAIDELQADNDSERAAYMLCRAALLHISAQRGVEHASRVAYRLGDEMATEAAR